jgi:hypothetical protein
LVQLAQGPVRTLHLREMTGADEELLFEAGGAVGAARVTALLARVAQPVRPHTGMPGAMAPWDGPGVPAASAAQDALAKATTGPVAVGPQDGPADLPANWPSHLALGDRDLLLLRLRQLDLGDAIHQVARCPHCASKVDVDFLISELPLRPAPEPGADGLHAVHIGQHTLYLRTPTGADQEAVETLALHNPAAANTRLFSRLVQRIEGPGGHEGAPDEAATRAWPMARRQALAQWLQSQLPGPDLYLDLACPHCQSDMSYVFDLHGFFLPRA